MELDKNEETARTQRLDEEQNLRNEAAMKLDQKRLCRQQGQAVVLARPVQQQHEADPWQPNADPWQSNAASSQGWLATPMPSSTAREETTDFRVRDKWKEQGNSWSRQKGWQTGAWDTNQYKDSGQQGSADQWMQRVEEYGQKHYTRKRQL